MIGIIYKMTILTTGKYYVGQHIGEDIRTYWGSGRIWFDNLNWLKNKFPKCWNKLVKKEILYKGECNQRTLDKLEEVYIRKERAHYSLGFGGCNVLYGTANGFGSGSPMKQRIVSEKVRIGMLKYHQEHKEEAIEKNKKRVWKLHNTDYKKKISETLKGKYVGEKNPNYGHYWTDEMKEALSKKMIGRYDGKKNPNYGHYWSEEQRKKISLKRKGKYNGENNPMFGKLRITNGMINTVIDKDSPLPEGFWYGMKKRKTL